MVRWSLLGLFFGALLLLSGCDSSTKIPTFKISGTVELNDKPLEYGTINLEGEAGSIPDSLTVKNGKFEGEAKLGKKKVKINAYEEAPPAMMDKTPVEGSNKKAIPLKEQTFTAEVTEKGLTPSAFKVEAQ